MSEKAMKQAEVCVLQEQQCEHQACPGVPEKQQNGHKGSANGKAANMIYGMAGYQQSHPELWETQRKEQGSSLHQARDKHTWTQTLKERNVTQSG